MKTLLKRKDTWACLLLVGLGIFIAMHSLSYRLGSLDRMGPGSYPLILGCLLTFIGVCLFFTSSVEKERSKEVDPINWKRQIKAWGLVIGSVIAFIVLGTYAGLVPATFFLVFISTFAEDKNTVRTAIVSAIVLTLFTVGLFHYGLKLQFPLFR